jgi:hypothetical protein
MRFSAMRREISPGAIAADLFRACHQQPDGSPGRSRLRDLQRCCGDDPAPRRIIHCACPLVPTVEMAGGNHQPRRRIASWNFRDDVAGRLILQRPGRQRQM